MWLGHVGNQDGGVVGEGGGVPVEQEVGDADVDTGYRRSPPVPRNATVLDE